jgi:MYXO-CTERM domain-containing protein
MPTNRRRSERVTRSRLWEHGVPCTNSVLATVVLVGLIALLPRQASAYCRTSVCDASKGGELCVPAKTTDCGIPLFWPQSCIGFSLNKAASKHIGLDAAQDMMQKAFDSWTKADCGAGTSPSIDVSNLGAVLCDQKVYNQQGGNTNLIVFRDDEWPYLGQGNTLGLTTVTFNLDDGSIFDADLEVNGTIDLTTGANIEYDLRSILTHEVGHMLGLAHSTNVDATMFVQYIPGETGLRSLSQDDMDAICSAYPPGEKGAVCDPTPRHGFSGDECSPESPIVVEEDCSCSVVGKPPSSSGTGGLVALLGLLGCLRRRKQNKP